MNDEKGFYQPELGYWQTVGGMPSLEGYPNGTIEVPLKPGADHEWQDGRWVYVEPKSGMEPIPDEISRRQFFQQLAVQEIITQADAIAAMTRGTVPVPLQTIIDILPKEEHFGALMLVIGATTFQRTHPLTEIVRQALQWSIEQKDIFWRDAARV